MSKQEFNKWKNKFRLWKTLHYDINLHEEQFCESCVHSLFMGPKLFRRCPDWKLVYVRENGIEEIRWVNGFLNKEVEFALCVEWIKYV